jgi:hypothetical protein
MDFIELFEGALDAEFCAGLVEAFERDPRVMDGRTGSGLDADKKRSRDLALDAHPEFREQLRELQRVTLTHLVTYVRRYPFVLIGGVTPTLRDPATGAPFNVDLAAFERLSESQMQLLIRAIFRSGVVNLQKYDASVGGYPHWHSEIFPQDARCEPLHRVLFYIYYLNDVDRGGETEFYFQAKKFRPKRGSLLVAPAGFTHAHRGNVPESGDKYVLASWLLYRRAEDLFRPR